MSSEVKRYDAVHLRYEDGNIRYGEGCEVEVVTAADYAALEAECERLRQQVASLQSDANSWQSGYDKGREDGAKAAEGWKAQHARDSAELRRLCSERDALAAELDNCIRSWSLARSECDQLRMQVQGLRAELAAIKGQEPVLYVNGEHLALALDNPCKEGRSASTSTVKGHYCDTPLYTTPPASPDVEGLVEALEWYEQQAAGCRKLTSEGDECGQALYSDGGKRAQIAIAAHRQAQPQ